MEIVGVGDILSYKLVLESVCFQESEICSDIHSQSNTGKTRCISQQEATLCTSLLCDSQTFYGVGAYIMYDRYLVSDL